MIASGEGTSLLSAAAKAHDALSRFGFFCSGICLGTIVFAYSYEIVARYFLNAPTTWASSAVSYLLCYMVFLAVPELSRRRGHIFISIVLDLMPIKTATFIQLATYILTAVACVTASFFCLDASISQYIGGIETVNEWQVPKWVLSVAIPYGFLSTGIHYLRHAASWAPYESSEMI
jgi:TRAP-type C4-dicarboxylate transport system permease small subunit